MTTIDRWTLLSGRVPAAQWRLLSIPHAGASPAIFKSWVTRLPDEIETRAFLAPGRLGRFDEAPHTRLDRLVDEAAAGAMPLLDRPWVLFGHSMGAIVAFELARRLRKMGARGPEHLFVSGHRAPHLPLAARPVHELSEPEFVEAMRKLAGAPDRVWDRLELRDLVLPTLRADLEICETYRYARQAPLETPITAMGGRDDPFVGADELAPWSEHTDAGFALRLQPGDHFYLTADVDRTVATIATDALPALEAG